MTAYVFSALAGAQALASQVDAALGYPCAGVNVGGGIHVMPPFVTQTYATPTQHPTLPLWSYPADAVTTPVLAPHAIALALPAPQVLDATWTPAVAVVQTSQVATEVSA